MGSLRIHHELEHFQIWVSDSPAKRFKGRGCLRYNDHDPLIIVLSIWSPGEGTWVPWSISLDSLEDGLLQAVDNGDIKIWTDLLGRTTVRVTNHEDRQAEFRMSGPEVARVVKLIRQHVPRGEASQRMEIAIEHELRQLMGEQT